MSSAGDLLVIRSAGAYGFVMASNYNARPQARRSAGGRRAVRGRDGARDVRRSRAAGAVDPCMEGSLMRVGVMADSHDRLPAIAELLRR